MIMNSDFNAGGRVGRDRGCPLRVPIDVPMEISTYVFCHIPDRENLCQSLYHIYLSLSDNNNRGDIEGKWQQQRRV